MFKALLGRRPATRGDVIIAAIGAVLAVFHLVDVHDQFKTEQEQEQEK